jgi:hypothetical protein
VPECRDWSSLTSGKLLMRGRLKIRDPSVGAFVLGTMGVCKPRKAAWRNSRADFALDSGRESETCTAHSVARAMPSQAYGFANPNADESKKASIHRVSGARMTHCRQN